MIWGVPFVGILLRWTEQGDAALENIPIFP